MAENVEPGDALAYSEELLPGEGTYDDGEQIRAAVYGTTEVDTENMAMTVKGLKRVADVEKGDIIVGQVTYTKPELASVKIIQIRGKEGQSTLQQVEATLHVSKIDNRYIKNLEDEYRCGDIIRAKVIGLKGGPQLVTDKPELGCIRAFSPEDMRRPLEFKQANRVRDPETGKIYARKTAEDYGSGQI
ncbi:MAG: exosome complex RNA-binding protein Csl4 [Thermoplasmatota archaeon]